MPSRAAASGSVTGLRARGGFTVDLAWADGQLTEVQLQASQRRRAVVPAKSATGVTAGGRPIGFERLGQDRIGFAAEPGVRYRIVGSAK